MSAEISLRLTEERSRIGFSQADMARKLGVTREALRKWEAGLSTIKAEALADAFQLGVDVQYVLTGLRSNSAASMNSAAITGSATSGVGLVMQGGVANVIHTTKHVTRTSAVVKPGDEHISDQQAAALTELVHKIVDTEAKLKKQPASFRSVWGALNKYCGVTQYRLIPSSSFERARSYLQTWIGRLSSMASAPVKDGDGWRKGRYAYIKVNTKAEEEQAALKRYILTNFKASSLTDLSNEELEKTYRYVAGKRARRKSPPA